MTVKRLDRGDIPFLLSAKSDGFSDCWNLNMLNSSFDSGRFTGFVAIDELGEKIGYITVTLGLDEEADIESVYTLSSKRKCGVGTALIGSVFSLNLKKIFLEVRESNLTAISLYEKNGFKKISVRKKYYPDGENAVIYLREI